AFIDVWRPHMERNGRDLEGQASKYEHQAEQDAHLSLRTADDGGDLSKVDATGVAIGQRNTVEHHAGAKRAENEILQSGLARARILTVNSGHDVERERLKLETEIERYQAVGRDHQH